MTILLGQIAPDFQGAATIGSLRLHQRPDASRIVSFGHPGECAAISPRRVDVKAS